jgi:L-rhamnose mutarotase
MAMYPKQILRFLDHFFLLMYIPYLIYKAFGDFMKVYAQALDLKNNKELINEYENHHKNVWPEVLEGLKSVGIIRMRIWRINNRLFMLIETSDKFDIEKFQKYTETNDKAKEWDALMKNYQEKIPNSNGEWWSEMTMAYDSEWN